MLETFESLQVIRSRTLRLILLWLPWFMLLVTLVAVIARLGSVMWYSGMMAVALGVFGFQVLMKRIRDTFYSLWSRGIIHTKLKNSDDTHQISAMPIPDSAPPEKQFRTFIEATSRLFNDPKQSFLGGFVGFCAVYWIIAPFLRSGGWPRVFIALTRPRIIAQIILEPFIGYVVGLLAWRMLFVGRQVWQLGRQFDLTGHLVGHPDRCGGLEPIGSLCLLNAAIIGIAGVYLGGWIIIANSPEIYQRLGLYYAPLFYAPIFKVLLLLPAVGTIISFLLPLWTTHQVMVTKRELLQQQLDQIGQSISHMAHELLNQADKLEPTETEKISKKLESMRQIYVEYRKIPVWPFNFRILSKLSTLEIMPLLAITGLGEPIAKAIAALFSFLTQTQ